MEQQESPRNARQYLDENERRQLLTGRTASQTQQGVYAQPSGQGADLPPPPMGQFSGRSSMPNFSNHSSHPQMPGLRKGGSTKGTSSIGNTGQGSAAGGLGTPSWQNSQWVSSMGWRQDSGGVFMQGPQALPGSSIGGPSIGGGSSIGGPSFEPGAFPPAPPLGRLSANQGMIGARQSQLGGQFASHLGSYGSGQSLSSQAFGGSMIGSGAPPQQKPSGFAGLPTSHLPHSAQPSPSTYAYEAPFAPFFMGPSLGSNVSSLSSVSAASNAAKFAIGQSAQSLPGHAKLADSVTSLYLSHGTSDSSKSIPQAPEPPPPSQASKVKVICNSGGQFVRMEGGAVEYQGGETRLVSVRSSCTLKELMASLERVMAYQRQSGSDKELSLRFQLPQERSTYVDLVDDEDVQLMFDEWQEYASQPTSAASAKLQVFVDMQRTSTRAPAPAAKLDKDTSSNSRSDDGSVPHTSTGAALPVATNAKPVLVVSDRLEIILPEDVSLVKFLGSGGYGEVYLGKWHSSEAAIKCLNASLFYPGGAGRQSMVNHAAVAELLKEAEMMARLRHPNIVWVYGVVLPPPDEHEADEDEDLDTCLPGEGPFEIGAACAQRAPQQNKPGTVRAPAIVTEFLSQGSLRAVLSRKSDVISGPLVRVLIAMDAAKGMEYLHSKKIVHFDLKSANLLLGHRDRRTICKVADFGLSKQKMDTYVSGVSSQRGTLPWIAPEIIKTPHAVTEMVDVYSFGIVLWELWTGREPYEGLNYHALLHQITTSTCVRPPLPGSPDWEQLGEPAPPEPAGEYSALLQACWQENPKSRPTFSGIVAELKKMAAELRPQRRASAPGGRDMPAKPAQTPPQPFAQAPGSEPASPHGNRPPGASAFVQPQPQ